MSHNYDDDDGNYDFDLESDVSGVDSGSDEVASRPVKTVSRSSSRNYEDLSDSDISSVVSDDFKLNTRRFSSATASSFTRRPTSTNIEDRVAARLANLEHERSFRVVGSSANTPVNVSLNASVSSFSKPRIGQSSPSKANMSGLSEISHARGVGARNIVEKMSHSEQELSDSLESDDRSSAHGNRFSYNAHGASVGSGSSDFESSSSTDLSSGDFEVGKIAQRALERRKAEYAASRSLNATPSASEAEDHVRYMMKNGTNTSSGSTTLVPVGGILRSVHIGSSGPLQRPPPAHEPEDESSVHGSEQYTYEDNFEEESENFTDKSPVVPSSFSVSNSRVSEFITPSLSFSPTTDSLSNYEDRPLTGPFSGNGPLSLPGSTANFRFTVPSVSSSLPASGTTTPADISQLSFSEMASLLREPVISRTQTPAAESRSSSAPVLFVNASATPSSPAGKGGLLFKDLLSNPSATLSSLTPNTSTGKPPIPSVNFATTASALISGTPTAVPAGYPFANGSLFPQTDAEYAAVHMGHSNSSAMNFNSLSSTSVGGVSSLSSTTHAMEAHSSSSPPVHTQLGGGRVVNEEVIATTVKAVIEALGNSTAGAASLPIHGGPSLAQHIEDAIEQDSETVAVARSAAASLAKQTRRIAAAALARRLSGLLQAKRQLSSSASGDKELLVEDGVEKSGKISTSVGEEYLPSDRLKRFVDKTDAARLFRKAEQQREVAELKRTLEIVDSGKKVQSLEENQIPLTANAIKQVMVDAFGQTEAPPPPPPPSNVMKSAQQLPERFSRVEAALEMRRAARNMEMAQDVLGGRSMERGRGRSSSSVSEHSTSAHGNDENTVSFVNVSARIKKLRSSSTSSAKPANYSKSTKTQEIRRALGKEMRDYFENREERTMKLQNLKNSADSLPPQPLAASMMMGSTHSTRPSVPWRPNSAKHNLNRSFDILDTLEDKTVQRPRGVMGTNFSNTVNVSVVVDGIEKSMYSSSTLLPTRADSSKHSVSNEEGVADSNQNASAFKVQPSTESRKVVIDFSKPRSHSNPSSGSRSHSVERTKKEKPLLLPDGISSTVPFHASVIYSDLNELPPPPPSSRPPESQNASFVDVAGIFGAPSKLSDIPVLPESPPPPPPSHLAPSPQSSREQSGAAPRILSPSAQARNILPPRLRPDRKSPSDSTDTVMNSVVLETTVARALRSVLDARSSELAEIRSLLSNTISVYSGGISSASDPLLHKLKEGFDNLEKHISQRLDNLEPAVSSIATAITSNSLSTAVSNAELGGTATGVSELANLVLRHGLIAHYPSNQASKLTKEWSTVPSSTRVSSPLELSELVKKYSDDDSTDSLMALLNALKLASAAKPVDNHHGSSDDMNDSSGDARIDANEVAQMFVPLEIAVAALEDRLASVRDAETYEQDNIRLRRQLQDLSSSVSGNQVNKQSHNSGATSSSPSSLESAVIASTAATRISELEQELALQRQRAEELRIELDRARALKRDLEFRAAGVSQERMQSDAEEVLHLRAELSSLRQEKAKEVDDLKSKIAWYVENQEILSNQEAQSARQQTAIKALEERIQSLQALLVSAMDENKQTFLNHINSVLKSKSPKSKNSSPSNNQSNGSSSKKSSPSASAADSQDSVPKALFQSPSAIPLPVEDSPSKDSSAKADDSSALLNEKLELELLLAKTKIKDLEQQLSVLDQALQKKQPDSIANLVRLAHGAQFAVGEPAQLLKQLEEMRQSSEKAEESYSLSLRSLRQELEKLKDRSAKKSSKLREAISFLRVRLARAGDTSHEEELNLILDAAEGLSSNLSSPNSKSLDEEDSHKSLEYSLELAKARESELSERVLQLENELEKVRAFYQKKLKSPGSVSSIHTSPGVNTKKSSIRAVQSTESPLSVSPSNSEKRSSNSTDSSPASDSNSYQMSIYDNGSVAANELPSQIPRPSTHRLPFGDSPTRLQSFRKGTRIGDAESTSTLVVPLEIVQEITALRVEKSRLQQDLDRVNRDLAEADKLTHSQEELIQTLRSSLSTVKASSRASSAPLGGEPAVNMKKLNTPQKQVKELDTVDIVSPVSDSGNLMEELAEALNPIPSHEGSEGLNMNDTSDANSLALSDDMESLGLTNVTNSIGKIDSEVNMTSLVDRDTILNAPSVTVAQKSAERTIRANQEELLRQIDALHIAIHTLESRANIRETELARAEHMARIARDSALETVKSHFEQKLRQKDEALFAARNHMNDLVNVIVQLRNSTSNISSNIPNSNGLNLNGSFDNFVSILETTT